MQIATGAWWTFLGDENLEVRRTFEIDEYTDRHHDNAVVPHTVVLAPGLVVERVYVGDWFRGRPSAFRVNGSGRPLRPQQARLRSDHGRGARRVG
jgi:hypothetical protein